MRIFSLLAILSLAACDSPRPDAPAAPAEAEVWQANARDRLCLKGNRAGFIVYGKGRGNCSARGRAVRTETQASITPDGDKSCTFNVGITGGRAILRAGSGAGCAYYCGPDAGIADVAFAPAAANTTATDNAGDDLC